ncbi:MAG: alpha/beta hydrolase [Pseudorhodobacter sp.]|nr:alpha/beta hydrolase [Pseudorhodobacter sp.]
MTTDRAYANSDFIPGGAGYLPRWQAQATAFRLEAGGNARLDRPYGPAPAQRFDLFVPSAPPRGVVVFIHGGYWLQGARQDYSHLARGAVARGWACALPSYTLAPLARIAAMAIEVGQAVTAITALVPGPVVITGHSAGGHLAARMGCVGAPLTRPPARVVPISPVAELAPMLDNAMNQTLHLDEAEVAAESPARLALNPYCIAHVWVGGQERPAFLWQARTLSEAWACPWTVAPTHHHFNVIDALADPASALIETLLGGA